MLGVGIAIVAFLAWYFSSIVTYIIISAILGMIGRPLVRWLTKFKIGKFHINKSLAASVTLVAIWMVFLAFFRFMIPLLASQFEELGNIDLQVFLKELEEPINKISQFFYGQSVSITDETFVTTITEKVGTFFNVSQITDLFGTIAGTIGSLMIALFAVSFITFFFLQDEGMLKRGILLLVPTDFEEKAEKTISRTAYLLRRYFIGLLLEVFMVMLLDTIGLRIVGINIKNALVIGLLAGLFNVIPYLGPWLGAAIGVLIGIAININANFINETLPLIGFMVLVFGSVQVIDNILFQPLIYSNSVKAHPLEIFLVIMAAGSLAGITGLILAIPVYTIVRVIASEFLSENKLVKSITQKMNPS